MLNSKPQIGKTIEERVRNPIHRDIIRQIDLYIYWEQVSLILRALELELEFEYNKQCYMHTQVLTEHHKEK